MSAKRLYAVELRGNVARRYHLGEFGKSTHINAVRVRVATPVLSSMRDAIASAIRAVEIAARIPAVDPNFGSVWIVDAKTGEALRMVR